jgi:hypothetical protein
MLFHNDLNLLLFFLAIDSLIYFDYLRLIFDFLFFADCLLQYHSFDGGLVRAKDLLLAVDDSHLPSGLISGAVLIFGVHMAVLMAMHGIAERLCITASSASASCAASSGLSLTPESSCLMIRLAAAAAPSSLTAAFARAAIITTLVQTAIISLYLSSGTVGNGETRAVSRPIRPPNVVVASDAAEEWIARLKVERREVEVTHFDVPCSEDSRNCR